MRILSVNNTADLYGASRCMERVYGCFADEGHEVHAVLPERGPLVSLLESRGVRVHIHPGLSILDRSEIGSALGCTKFVILFPFSVARIALLAIRLRIDVVHTNTVVMPSPAVAAFLTARPHVWHVREMLGEFGSFWKIYQKYISFFSSAIATISRCTQDQFAPSIRTKSSVVYDGLNESLVRVDPVRRQAFRDSLPADKVLIGVVGRIKWLRKGQEVLVRALALLKDRQPDLHCVFIGSTAPGNEEHLTRLRQLVSDSGLDDRVTFVGDTKDAISVLAALDIAVVPSVQPEPFGCVVIEAMAAGTPVIGSDCGGIAEQIVDGVSGLLFPPGNSDALATAIERLLNDPMLRSRLIDGGLRRVYEDFPLENTYRSMLDLFGKVTRRGANAALSRKPS